MEISISNNNKATNQFKQSYEGKLLVQTIERGKEKDTWQEAGSSAATLLPNTDAATFFSNLPPILSLGQLQRIDSSDGRIGSHWHKS